MENQRKNFQELKEDGIELFTQGNFKEANETFFKCLEFKESPKDIAAIHLNISGCFYNLYSRNFQLENLKKSETHADESIKLNPSYLKAFWRKFKIFEISNKKEKCLENLNICRKLDSKNTEINFNYCWINWSIEEEKRQNKEAKEINSISNPYVSWYEGLGHKKYEWIVDCYRLRKDDDYVWKGKLKGIYNPDNSEIEILKDFYVFCCLLKLRNMLPKDWDWKEFLTITKRLICFAFEKSDASEKYGTENIFVASLGGRSLRFTSSIIYGYSHCDQGSKDDLEKLIVNYLYKEKLTNLKDFDKYKFLFKDLGGDMIWVDLGNSLKIKRY